MIWLVGTILLGLAAIYGVLHRTLVVEARRVGPAITVGAIAVWVVMTFFLSVHTVGQREVGIIYNFSGTIAGKKDPGVVMTAPWQHIETENVALEKETFDFGADNSAVSKDQQPITAQLVVNIQVHPQDVVALYKSVGPNWRSILLDGRVPQDFKETTAKFTSPQITLERPQLRIETLQRLRRELCPTDGEFCVHVEDVFVQNVGYSREYTKAIEAKQVQVQAALRAQAKVAEAEAEARQTVAKAEGEAKAIALKGKALRNNPEVLKLNAIEKLNPNAQVIFCSAGDCPTVLGQLGGTSAAAGASK